MATHYTTVTTPPVITKSTDKYGHTCDEYSWDLGNGMTITQKSRYDTGRLRKNGRVYRRAMSVHTDPTGTHFLFKD